MITSTTTQYDIQDLLYLMRRLRNPETGCPWDIRQTFTSLIKYTIEEAYEVADAITQDDSESICEELGDLLLQVIFYAQIAQEKAEFQFDDVVHGLVSKMIRRHPHVFPEGDLQSVILPHQRLNEAEIKQQWQKIKAEEVALKNKSKSEKVLQELSQPIQKSALSGISHKIPALQTAEKIQRKAALVGFDWDSAHQVLEKIKEEVSEVEEAMVLASEATNTSKGVFSELGKVKEEIGDLLFACVNLARHYELDSENLLRSANLKFEKRFQAMETILAESGQDMASQNTSDLEHLWQEVKRNPI